MLANVIAVAKYKHSGLYTAWQVNNEAAESPIRAMVDIILVTGAHNELAWSKAVRIAAILNEK
jgi:hypothetical protein